MHLDIETDDQEAEVRRLEALGATRYDHQQECGYDFWVLRDPWGNEFCVLEPNFPDLLDERPPWPAQPTSTTTAPNTAIRSTPALSAAQRSSAAARPHSAGTATTGPGCPP